MTEQRDIEIDRVTFYNEDSGWSVCRCKDVSDNTDFVAVGYVGKLRQGAQYKLLGSWTEHRQYGRQFAMERSIELRPSSRKGMLRYLASGVIPGIGPKTAKKIVDYFGEETFAILDQDPQRLSEVDSIGDKKVAAVIDAWHENRALHDTRMFLNEHGISPLFANRIVKAYGSQAVSLVAEDPYQLARDIQGIGFIKADEVARTLGIAADSDLRIRAAVIYLMQRAEDFGDCFLWEDQIQSKMLELLKLSHAILAPKLLTALKILCQAGTLFEEKDQNQKRRFYRPEFYAAEIVIADRVRAFAAEPLAIDQIRIDTWLQRYNEAMANPLSEEQIKAVKAAVSSRIFILTGGPGVGKTTTANAIIRLLKAMGRSVSLCAPTGRAAQRLSEVSALPAKTVHRTLEWNPGMGFQRNDSNPLEVQSIICDEASMLDLRLARALIDAVPAHAQLILIGDVDQLPSVGPGNVLSDLLSCPHIPSVRLTQVFRQAQASYIIRYAHQMNQGHTPVFDQADKDSDCQFFEHADPEEIKASILRIIEKEVEQRLGMDPQRDLQVLTPMNRGPLGTEELNNWLQPLLNPKAKGPGFYPGDRVIQTVNNYELGVFNGDIGFVNHTHVSDGKMIVDFGGDRQVIYTRDNVGEIRLAYAITIHKSQGSEFPVAILPISYAHYVMLQRNLVYTGLTRAKKQAFFVGELRALRHAIHTVKAKERQTTLDLRASHPNELRIL